MLEDFDKPICDNCLELLSDEDLAYLELNNDFVAELCISCREERQDRTKLDYEDELQSNQAKAKYYHDKYGD